MARAPKIFWQIVLVVFLWRTALFGVGALADRFLPYQPSFPYATERLAQLSLPRWLYSWANFDGVHYLTIVEKGYVGTGSIQAFFPVFPLLLRLFGAAPVVGGLLLNISLACLVAIALYSLARLDHNEKRARWTLAAFLLFPTSFFLGALYTEALFLLLVLGSFWAARTQRWLLAGVLTGIASGTRIVGTALFPALLLELWYQNRRNQPDLKLFFSQNLKHIACISLSLTGLVFYMLYLWRTFGDPLFFFHVQSEFGAGRQESLVLFPQVLWRALKIIWTARPFDWKYFAYVQELVLSLATLAPLGVWWKKIRLSYLLFALTAFFIPTLTGTLSSMPRYVLACFPLFFLLGEFFEKKPIWRTFLLTASTLLLIINTVLFIQGYWVA